MQSGSGTHDVCDFSIHAGEGSAEPPVADAGPDQNVTDGDDNGSETVTLNGSGSHDPDGQIVNYRWTEGSTLLAQSANPSASVTLSVGTHAITLEVTDNTDLSDTDDVSVTVNASGGGTTPQSSVTCDGITWTFNHAYPVGQYANGDFYVVGPVTVTAISPPPSGGLNGSMVNPPGGVAHAYDNRVGNYDSGLAVYAPLTLQANQSLVSTKSWQNDEPGAPPVNPTLGCPRPSMHYAAVLTCVGSAPPDGSFRPPYCGTSKPQHHVSQLRWDRLPQLAAVPSTPGISEVENYFSGVWIDNVANYPAQDFLHPSANMPWYGRDLAAEIGDASLLLMLNIPNNQKQTLLIRLVQLGIDLNGIAQNGGFWSPNGGIALGRKWPILFAGYLLADAQMSAIGSSDVLFQDDAQTFYVEETSPGVYNWGYGGYDAGDVGMPEWGIRHATDVTMDNKDWGAPYRECCTANAWVGHVLAARILGLQAAWNHDALFDYQDRYMVTETEPWMRAWTDFAREMWDTYRSQY